MATGKSKTKNGWTKEEEAIFEEFGIGEGEVSLRRLIRGQRKINGRLYRAIALMLEAFDANKGNEKMKLSSSAEKLMNKARKLNAGVPGDPPGCDDKGLG